MEKAELFLICGGNEVIEMGLWFGYWWFFKKIQGILAGLYFGGVCYFGLVVGIGCNGKFPCEFNLSVIIEKVYVMADDFIVDFKLL